MIELIEVKNYDDYDYQITLRHKETMHTVQILVPRQWLQQTGQPSEEPYGLNLVTLGHYT
jgi:hypothetical protein